jgi:hypothetical protein
MPYAPSSRTDGPGGCAGYLNNRLDGYEVPEFKNIFRISGYILEKYLE